MFRFRALVTFRWSRSPSPLNTSSSSAKHFAGRLRRRRLKISSSRVVEFVVDLAAGNGAGAAGEGGAGQQGMARRRAERGGTGQGGAGRDGKERRGRDAPSTGRGWAGTGGAGRDRVRPARLVGAVGAVRRRLSSASLVGAFRRRLSPAPFVGVVRRRLRLGHRISSPGWVTTKCLPRPSSATVFRGVFRWPFGLNSQQNRIWSSSNSKAELEGLPSSISSSPLKKLVVEFVVAPRKFGRRP